MRKNTSQEIKTKKSEMVGQTGSANHWAVSKYLGELKFLPRLMGVDEADVWKKIEKLCELYENTLTEERGKSERFACQRKACCAKCKACTAAEKRPEEAQSND